MGQQLPLTLNWFGRTLLHASNGRDGSKTYVDAAGGFVHQMFPAVVLSSGPLYAVVTKEDQMPGKIRVDNDILLNAGVGTVNIGDRLLVGPLQAELKGLAARGAWRLPNAPPGPTPPSPMVPRPPFPELTRRRRGTIKSVHTPGAYHGTPDYAFFVDELTNTEIFGHKSQLRPGVYFAVARRYWFTLGSNHKGPAAFDIQFA